MKKRIPIVLAADNNYRYPLMVTMLSAIMNADEGTEYQFIILISEKFEFDSIKLINKLLQQYNMPEAVFYDMHAKYSDMKIHVNHLTYACFYRLQLPELLKDVDKCIYLDVDTIVKKDLSLLFDIDLEDNYIAGVKAAGYYYPEDKKEKNREMLGIKEFNQYINSGVLSINLKKMRKDNLLEYFNELLKKDFPSHDQDILNVACYDHIKILPPKYNAMTKYNVGDKEAYNTIESLPLCYSREEWNEACDSPIIIHYADRWKPWQDLRGEFVEEWWKCAMVLEKQEDYSEWIVRNISTYQTRVISDLQNKKAEVSKKLQKAYDEKSEINAKLQKTYAEKSEINAKLKKAYEEKTERGEKIKELHSEIEIQKRKFHENKKLLKETTEELNEAKQQIELLRKEKEEAEKHLLVRVAKKICK